MKILNLKIELTEKLNLNDQDKLKSCDELCSLVITNVMLSYGQQQRGFEETERKKFYKITDAMDKAVELKTMEVELEDDWMGFLKKCFRETKLIPNPLLRVVEENVLMKDA